MVYATGSRETDRGIWQYSRAELEAGIQGGPCINPLVRVNPLSTLSSLMPGDAFLPNDIDLLNGIVSDNSGNIYVAGWLTDTEKSGFLLKYDAAGVLLDKATLSPSFVQSRGIVWSENTNRLFIANQTDDSTVDCISVFDAGTLDYVGTGAPNPGLPENNAAKALSIIKECCPSESMQVVDQTYCVAGGNDKLFLNELFPCDGVICEAQWAPVDAASLAIYESCDQSIAANLSPGCYSFTRSSDGLNGKLCGAFEQTFNLEIVDLGTVSVSPDQVICTGDSPAQLSISTTSAGTIQWQVSTTSCIVGFSDIPSANSMTYQPPALNETSYYRVVINEGGGCSSELCSYESDCITVNVTSLSANESSELCNDNNTPTDITDDYITFSLNPSGTNLGSSYSLSVDNGATVTQESGAAATGITYGAATSFRLQNGSADGTTTFTITITDDGTNGCSITTSLMQNSCFTCVNPAFTATAQEGTCNGETANNDAVINLTGITNGEEAGISPGSSFTGATFGSPSNLTISSGALSFDNLQHNTQYTVRVFNADSTCFTDQTLTTPDINCTIYFSLGNRVFYDDDLNGVQNGTEAGIDGVQLQLLNADGTIYDSDNTTPGSQALIVTTAGGGYYRFDNLPAGNYIVEILPDAFLPSSVLENYLSSQGAGQEADPNLDVDMNDNGLDIPLPGTVQSGVISLGETEPTGEAEPTVYLPGSSTGTAAADTESNLTVDFGFYRQRDRPDFEDPLQNPCPEEPCHFISNDIYLGSGVSNDAASNSSTEADTDTDDGLIWGDNLRLSPGGTMNLPVVLYNNTGGDAYLRIWIDWNADGDFDDMNEQVADELYLSAVYSGTFQTNLPVVIPTDATQNQDIALRLRLSTDNSNTADPCGNGTCAADGEIEDFLLRIRCSNRICLPVSLSVN